jgi:hypothetical protein
VTSAKLQIMDGQVALRARHGATGGWGLGVGEVKPPPVWLLLVTRHCFLKADC